MWRAKHFSLYAGKHWRLHVTVRRFFTTPTNRSKKHKQWVVQIYMGPIREVAFSIERIGRRPVRKQRVLSLRPYPVTAVIVLGLLGTTLFSIKAFSVHALEPVTPSSSVVAKKPVPEVVYKSLPRSIPNSITIAAQNISANVIPVGQAADGSIQMPPVLQWVTGWYQNSPTPGQIGPSIIVGHVDNYENISVFWRLRYLVPGNIISIGLSDGATANFAIDSVQNFDQANFPSSLVYGNIPYAGIRLITCGGTFSKATESYNQNTVVFGHLI